MALSREQQEQLAELERLRDEPDEPDEPEGADDGHVIVLRGSRADQFLTSLLGPAPSAGKSAPAGKRGAGNAARPPAKTQRDDQGDDQGADDQGAPDDVPPPRGPRYFR